MDKTSWYYRKWNKSYRERQTPYNFIYMQNLKSKQNRNRFKDEKNKLIVAWGVGIQEREKGVEIKK